MPRSSQSHHSGIESVGQHHPLQLPRPSQSHHSGIERARTALRTLQWFSSQSHHSGIERTVHVGQQVAGQVGPNRTTVGLKEALAASLGRRPGRPNRTTVGLKV